jgi:carbon monoxide dehydrogenase subunit G
MPGIYAAELTRRVAVDPADVWAALADTTAYRTWWPWLQDFEADGGLATGATWRAGIRAPMPYVVAFTLDLRAVDSDARTVDADVSGDVTGSASIGVDGDGEGARLRATWHLTPARSFLRLLDATARPLAKWGHDTVMRRSVDAFVRAVEQTRPPWPSTSR